MFPTDATTIRYEINGVGSVVLASSTRTILYTTMQKATANKTSQISCGSYVLSSNFSTNIFNSNPIQYVCNDTITLSATSNGTASFVLTYIPRDITATINPNTGSTTPFYANGFSYGDIISNMLLLFIFTLLFFKTLKEWIFGTKVDGASAIKIEKWHNI
jgi:hypothetical protein